jgi:chemotaxis protein methyltransferase CheR
VYGTWSFRAAPPWFRSGYFSGTAHGPWALAPAIKRMATFRYLNLAEDLPAPVAGSTGSMDIILCRNVLMYLAPEVRTKVVRNFYRALADGGWLIVSPAETSPSLFADFEIVIEEDALLYRKPASSAIEISSALGEPSEEEPLGREPPKPSPSVQFACECLLPAETRATPMPAPPSYEAAWTFYLDGDYERAREMALEVLPSRPSERRTMLLLAQIDADRGRLPEALRWLEYALAEDQTDARAHYLRATILSERGSLEQARAALRAALYLDREFILAHLAMGNLALAQGRTQEVEKHFQNVLELLAGYRQGDIVPESGGLTAGRLRAIVAGRVQTRREGRSGSRPEAVRGRAADERALRDGISTRESLGGILPADTGGARSPAITRSGIHSRPRSGTL